MQHVGDREAKLVYSQERARRKDGAGGVGQGRAANAFEQVTIVVLKIEGPGAPSRKIQNSLASGDR